MVANDGYIYVLTNPSFPEYVKIGYADNVDERLNQLNRSECTPFAFRKYATLHVANRLADKIVHKIIDRFKPELRSKENVNGKMRVREFFAMPAQEAVELLRDIGDLYGETPVVYSQSAENKQDEQIAEQENIASERLSPFSFYKCGIHNGEEIVFVSDESIVCKVVGDRDISYNGKTTSLSALAKKLLHRNSTVQGTLHFSYHGEVLSALRKRLEDEGKYNQELVGNDSSDKESDCSVTDTSDCILFFTMEKYKAKCQRVEDGYLLLKGSQIASSFTQSCRNGVKELREKYSSIISAEFVLLDDIMFSSSSSAAEFVSGSSKNGKLYWRTADGILLKDILEKESK